MAKILELRFNEAASGTGTTAILDSSGNSFGFTANFDGSNGSWLSDANGRWLNCSASPNTSTFNIQRVMNTGLGALIQGLQKFSLVFRQRAIGAGDYPESPIFTIQNTGGASYDMSMVAFDAGGAAMRCFRFGSGEAAWYGDTDIAYVLVVDTTLATAADRVKIYRKASGGNNSFVSAPPIYTAPTLNYAFTGVNDATTFFTFMNDADLSNNMQGGCGYFRMDTQLFTQSEAFSILDNLAANDDADPYAPPTLTWLSAPAVGSGPTTTSVRIDQTTSLAASLSLVVGASGSSQPSDATFNASAYQGSASASTAFQFNVSGLTANTAYRMWVRATASGQTTLYASVNVTTLAASSAIISVNGGNPIRRGQTGVVVLRQGGATGTTATTWNGVTQANHTVISDTESRFDVVHPNMIYGNTANVVIGAQSITSPVFLPPSGYDYVLLRGYNPSGTVGEAETTPAAVDGNQFVWNTEGGTILFLANGLPEFTSSFDGTVTFAVVDSADGAHSSFVTLTYGTAADLIPDAFSLGADVTGANPGAITTRTFTLAGVTPGNDVSCGAIGVGEVSTNGTDWSSTVMYQNGNTVRVRGAAGNFGQTVTVGCVIGGISDTFTITTRSANVPVITVQPSNANVTAGQNATFTLSATGASSYQWYEETGTTDTPISGATSSSYTRNAVPLSDNGKQFYCIVTSSEGGTVTSATRTLTVNAANVTITSQPLRDASTKQLRASVSNIPVRIRRADGTIALSTTVNTNASGIWTLTNNTMGVAGQTVYVEFPDSGSGSYAGFSYVL